MNYYERHIGDYLKDTAHLSLLEHGVYTRLMDVYYTREGAIPAGEAARLIGARSKDEREALAAVLAEFFVLVDGCHVQARCDREIERFKDKQAKAKRSAELRWAKGDAHSAGNANASANASANAMRTHSEGNAPRARPQSPVTSNQTPVREITDVISLSGASPPGGEEDPPPGGTPAGDASLPDSGVTEVFDDAGRLVGSMPAARTRVAEVCIALRAAGVSAVNPAHPRLKVLVDAGADIAEFLGFVEQARTAAPGREFAYVLAAVANERQRAAAMTGTLAKGRLPTKQENLEARNRAVGQEVLKELREMKEGRL